MGLRATEGGRCWDMDRERELVTSKHVWEGVNREETGGTRGAFTMAELGGNHRHREEQIKKVVNVLGASYHLTGRRGISLGKGGAKGSSREVYEVRRPK